MLYIKLDSDITLRSRAFFVEAAQIPRAFVSFAGPSQAKVRSSSNRRRLTAFRQGSVSVLVGKKIYGGDLDDLVHYSPYMQVERFL